MEEAFEAGAGAGDDARGRVEAVAGRAEADGAAVDVVREVEDRGEGVGELQDAGGGDDGGEAGEVGDGGAR